MPGRPYKSLWHELRSDETSLVLRISVSVALGALLAGLGILGGYAVGIMSGSRSAIGGWVTAALLTATAVWLIALWCVWRRVRHGKLLVGPLIATVILCALTIVGAVLVEEFVGYYEGTVQLGLILCCGGLVVLLWLATLQRLFQGKRVLGSDDLVDVRCPKCGYSLIGLTELRCPECGTRFTIDELIRAQDYARPRKPHTAEPPQHAED